MSAMATVSPKIICMAVDVTGARSKGHSSRSRGRCTDRWHSDSNVLPRWLVTPTRRAPRACGPGREQEGRRACVSGGGLLDKHSLAADPAPGRRAGKAGPGSGLSGGVRARLPGCGTRGTMGRKAQS